LIVDVNMPRMNGIDLLKCLKERNINTPSIIITGIKSKKVQKEAVALKVSNVIDKPFSLHEVLRSIQQGLDKAETLNQS